MRLFDLVEQDDAVGVTAHGFRELAALLVADVARRRSDESCDGMLLHVLRHVDADHAALIVEKRLRQGLRQFRLADARRAEEDERADWAVRIFDARTRPQDCLADDAHGLILSNDALMQYIFESQELLALAREHL